MLKDGVNILLLLLEKVDIIRGSRGIVGIKNISNVLCMGLGKDAMLPTIPGSVIMEGRKDSDVLLDTVIEVPHRVITAAR